MAAAAAQDFGLKLAVTLARERFGDIQTHCVPNSVDTMQFFASERGKQLIPTVGLLYSTHVVKGADVAFAALDRARKALPNLRILLWQRTHFCKPRAPAWS